MQNIFAQKLLQMWENSIQKFLIQKGCFQRRAHVPLFTMCVLIDLPIMGDLLFPVHHTKTVPFDWSVKAAARLFQ